MLSGEPEMSNCVFPPGTRGSRPSAPLRSGWCKPCRLDAPFASDAARALPVPAPFAYLYCTWFNSAFRSGERGLCWHPSLDLEGSMFVPVEKLIGLLPLEPCPQHLQAVGARTCKVHRRRRCISRRSLTPGFESECPMASHAAQHASRKSCILLLVPTMTETTMDTRTAKKVLLILPSCCSQAVAVRDFSYVSLFVGYRSCISRSAALGLANHSALEPYV